MRVLIIFGVALSLSAQTIYLRSSGPASVSIANSGGLTPGTPPTINTLTAHHLNVGDVVGLRGICTGSALAPSPVNGIRKVASVPTPTSFTITDLSGVNIVEPNAQIDCGAPVGQPFAVPAWVGKLTAFTLGAQPLGWLDGKTGPTMRKLALSTDNGLANSGGVVVRGCPGSCVVTITTDGSFTHGVAATDKFSIWNTTSQVLNMAGATTGTTVKNIMTVTPGNPTTVQTMAPHQFVNGHSVTVSGVSGPGTCNGSGTVMVVDATSFTVDYSSVGCSPTANTGTATIPGTYGAPFTAASVTATTIASAPFTASGLTNGDYTHNDHCGPSATPNDLIGGTQNCVSVSQLAYVGNPMWDSVLISSDQEGTYNGSTGHVGRDIYKFVPDGDTLTSCCAYSVALFTAEPAIRFIVDRASTRALEMVMYYLNNVERLGGVNWVCNEDLGQCANNDFNDYISDILYGLAWPYMAGRDYLSAAHRQTFLDKIYNDVDDPAVTNVTYKNVNPGGDTHNKALARGFAADGDATSITLATDPGLTSLVGSIVQIYPIAGSTLCPDKTHACYGQSGPKFGTYVSGGSITGSAGQTCALTGFDGGGASAFGRVALTGTNTIASGTPIYMESSVGGYTSSPTSATLTSGSATCSGTATLSTIAGFGGVYGVYGRITAYSSSSKVATVAGWESLIPAWLPSPLSAAAGVGYRIYAGVTLADRTPRATTTATGYNTTWNTPGAVDQVHVGDVIMGGNGWQNASGYYPSTAGSYVTAVSSDTSLTVVNMIPGFNGVGASTTPSMSWVMPKWAPGDAGLASLQKHWSAWPGSNMTLYPIVGGSAAWYPHVGEGGNNSVTMVVGHMAMSFAAASDDQRAVRNLAFVQGFGFDYIIRHYMNYVTGTVHSGNNYSAGVNMLNGWAATILQQSVPTFPSLDLTGPWMQGVALFKVYGWLPDLHNWHGGPAIMPVPFGARNGQSDLAFNPAASVARLNDANFRWSPTSKASQYLRYHLENTATNLWTHSIAWSNYDDVPALLSNDPRIVPRNYSEQPTQYAFINSSSAACAALTGWPCPTSFQGNMVISRTGWTNRSDSLLFYQSRAYSGDDSLPDAGMLQLFKVGGLLSCDCIPGLYDFGWDLTRHGDMLRFGGTSSNVTQGTNNPGLTSILRWASANHGTWDAAYGDKDSNYMYVTSDLKGIYPGATINYAHRSIAHLKKPGTEEIIIQYDSVDVSGSPTSIDTHVHYSQNGQLATLEPGVETNSQMYYDEGQTTCPGSGGCANLNVNRTIKSLESGAPEDGLGPARTFGIVTRFLSPGTITVQDDTPPVEFSGVTAGNPTIFTAPGYSAPNGISIVGATSPWNVFNSGSGVVTAVTPIDADHFSLAIDSTGFSGSFKGTIQAAYPGGFGYSHRVSVCAGSSCGAAVSTFDALIVHKVAQNLTDTTLRTTPLNPDPNWTGVQTADKVVLFARGGVTHSAVTGFTTMHRGTAQYLFGGLTPGTYVVSINGMPVPGNPFNVTAGDNTIEFESTAGAVSVNASVIVGSTSNSTISGKTSASADVNPRSWSGSMEFAPVQPQLNRFQSHSLFPEMRRAVDEAWEQ